MIIIPLILTMLAGATGAPAPLALGLDQAVEATLQNNPGLKSLSHQLSAAEGRSRAASRTRWGQLDAFFNTSHTNDDWLVRPMSEQLFEEAGGFAGLPWDRNQVHYGAIFRLPLYTGGSLTSGIEIARLQLEGVGALAEGTRWQLRFNATSLYAAAQALDQVLIAQDEQITALMRTKENLDLMVQVGKRPELDRLKIVAALEAARSGRAVASPEALRESLQLSSSLRRARFAVEQADQRVTAERSSFFPRVMASGNYSWHDAPSIDGTLDTWELNIGVTVPLFVGGSRSENLSSARDNAAAAGQDLERIRLETAAGLVDSVAAFGAAQKRIVADRARVAAASEAARIEEIRFDSGAGAVEDYLIARAEDQEARAALARSLAGARSAGERINSIVETEVVR